MSDVKRYDFVDYEEFGECKDGRYVDYQDHMTLYRKYQVLHSTLLGMRLGLADMGDYKSTTALIDSALEYNGEMNQL